MPAYNEEDNIETVVKSWYHILEGKNESSRLIVSDSGSSDRTHQILMDLKEKYPKLEVLESSEKTHGPKVIALYDYAIKNNVDYIFQTDSDGQTNPEEFEQFWELRKKCDGIFGNRIKREDGKIRAFVEYVVCILLRLFFGVKIANWDKVYMIVIGIFLLLDKNGLEILGKIQYLFQGSILDRAASLYVREGYILAAWILFFALVYLVRHQRKGEPAIINE